MKATITPWWLNLKSVWINQLKEKRVKIWCCCWWWHRGGPRGRSGIKLEPPSKVSLYPKNVIGLTCTVVECFLACAKLVPPRPGRSKNWCIHPLTSKISSTELCVRGSVPVFVCVLYTHVHCVLLSESAYLVGGKRLTFPHSWGHLGHARG